MKSNRKNTPNNQFQPAAKQGDVKQMKAEQVDNRPEAILQRQLQQKANQVTVPTRPEPAQRKENNTGLPDNLKSGVENLSGLAMDDVRVHRNSDKPAQLNAHAYAQGTDIHLAAGQEKHLPHEAWHVVQQKQGRVKPTMQMKGKVAINDDAGLEREADVMGAKALMNSTNQVENNIHSLQPKGRVNGKLVQRLLWPKKSRDQPKGEGTEWEGNPELKAMYIWSETEVEFEDWLEDRTPVLWRAMMDHSDYDPHRADDIKSFRKIEKREVIEEPKAAPAAKEKPREETVEERQIRLALEFEKRKREEQHKRALEREARWDDAVYAPIVASLSSNPIATAAWNLIVARLKSGSKQEDISGLDVYAYNDLLAAVLVWRAAARTVGLITYMSKFNTVQDKSKREDGGKNTVNLVSRKYQASFILDTEIGRINLHVDANPPL